MYDLEIISHSTEINYFRVEVSVLLRVSIMVFVFYFCYIEYKQSNSIGVKRFYNPWNNIDLLYRVLLIMGEVLNIITSPLKNSQEYSRIIRTIYSLTALIMWLRCLYYFRIFESMNFYIKMLTLVI